MTITAQGLQVSFRSVLWVFITMMHDGCLPGTPAKRMLLEIVSPKLVPLMIIAPLSGAWPLISIPVFQRPKITHESSPEKHFFYFVSSGLLKLLCLDPRPFKRGEAERRQKRTDRGNASSIFLDAGMEGEIALAVFHIKRFKAVGCLRTTYHRRP